MKLCKKLAILFLFTPLIINLSVAMESNEKAIQNVLFRSSILTLASRGLKDEQICSLASCIKDSPHITQLNLNHNFFGDVGIKSLSNVLNTLPNLTHLHLYGAKITDIGFMELFASIEQAPSILFLDIRDTLISDNGILKLNDLCNKRPKLILHSSFINVSQELLLKALSKNDLESK